MRVGVVLHDRRTGRIRTDLDGRGGELQRHLLERADDRRHRGDVLGLCLVPVIVVLWGRGHGFRGGHRARRHRVHLERHLEQWPTPGSERHAWRVPGLDLVHVGIVLPGGLLDPRRRPRSTAPTWTVDSGIDRSGQPLVRVLPHAGVLRGRRLRRLRADVYRDPAGAGQPDAAVDHGQPDRGYDPDGRQWDMDEQPHLLQASVGGLRHGRQQLRADQQGDERHL